MIKRLMILILCFTFLTGCWDRKELNDIGIVVGVALDKDLATNQLIITCEVIRSPALKNDGREATAPTRYVSSKGFTIFEAVRNLSKKVDRKSFFSHNKVIIISEKIATDGVAPILDIFARDYETRPLVWLMVAKNSEAKEVLGINHGIETVQALYLEDIIDRKWATSEVQVSHLIDFYKNMIGNGTNPIAGAIEISKDVNDPQNLISKELRLAGAAVFKKDKLIGYLNDKETRGLNWITGNVKSGIINVPGISNDKKLISLEIKRASRHIKPQIEDEQYKFNIDITETGIIGEVQDTTDVADWVTSGEIESEQERVIKEEINLVINKAQNDLHCDIFGFGNTLYRSYPKEWKKVKDDWNDMFAKAQFKINVDVKYKRMGEITKPFSAK